MADGDPPGSTDPDSASDRESGSNPGSASAPDGESGPNPDSDPESNAAGGSDGEPEDATALPADVIDRAERLTRLAREAVDENERAAYRRERDALLTDHGEDGYVARVREDDSGATLVLYPGTWLDGEVVDVERIDDTDRAVERSLSGPGSGDDWAAVEGHNRAVADRVREVHGEVHGETAHAFADFMSNHYAKPIERATPGERAEFREEYLPRNAWPSAAQLDRLERSLELIVETAESL